MLDQGMWGMHWGWWIFWTAFLIFAARVAIRSLANKSSRASSASPLEILQRRYASGDISTEEYEERKTQLEQDQF